MTAEAGSQQLLAEYIQNHDHSLGVSNDFGYLPITFFNNRSYSGFNDEVENMQLKDMDLVCS